MDTPQLDIAVLGCLLSRGFLFSINDMSPKLRKIAEKNDHGQIFHAESVPVEILSTHHPGLRVPEDSGICQIFLIGSNGMTECRMDHRKMDCDTTRRTINNIRIALKEWAEKNNWKLSIGKGSTACHLEEVVITEVIPPEPTMQFRDVFSPEE